MNNYYTLIYLIKEWKTKLNDSIFVEAVSSKRNELQLYFQGHAIDFRLIFNSSGQRCAIFLDKYQIPQRLNTAIFFNELKGEKLVDIRLADGDRYITFSFGNSLELIFLLYSNNANVLLADGQVILDAFKNSGSQVGEKIPLPSQFRKIADSPPPKKMNDLIMIVDPLLPRSIIKYYLSDAFESGKANAVEKEIVNYSMRLKKQIKPHFHPGYGFGLLPIGLLKGNEVKMFESVNQAVAYSYYQTARYFDFELKKKEIVTRIERVRNKLERSVQELEKSDISLKKADYFEKIGHILMANPAKNYKSDEIELEDFYDEMKRISVKVEMDLDNVENAQKYYQKAKNTRKSYESAIQRKIEIKRRLTQITNLQESVLNIGYLKELQKWLGQNAELLQKIGLSGSDSANASTSFKSFNVSGYQIKVGKSATANDELLRITHKEDIWLHARGVPGSHVIISMSGVKDYPDKSIIEQAAKIAAFFSKAKGSSLVPVIFTKRKYVRKSKGMAPGAVFVDKEQVILVEPVAPV